MRKQNKTYATIDVCGYYGWWYWLSFTGYGYIQFRNETFKNEVHPVITFTEKPDAQRAAKFVSSGEYLWNSGIFVWKAKSIISSIEKYLSDQFQFNEKQNWFGTSFERLMIADLYAICENVHNYIVVDTTDVLLICQIEKEQDIKQYVSEVKNKRRTVLIFC